MTSMSVKNRAKMFEGLASSNHSDELTPRKGTNQRGGNAVSSSPFLTASSPTRSAATVPFVSSYMSSSPRSSVSAPFQQMKDRPISFGGASPRARNSNSEWERPMQYGGSPISQVHMGESREHPFHQHASPRTKNPPSAWIRPSLHSGSPRTGSAPLDWPGEEEDSIPGPSGPKKYQSSINVEYLKPVILPCKSPLFSSPTNAMQNPRLEHHVKTQSQSPVSGSPFKALQNKDFHFKTQSPILSKHFIKLQSQADDHLHAKVIKIQSKTETVMTEKKKMAYSEDLPQDRSINSDGENNAPEVDGGKTKSSRALRLQRAKHAGAISPSPVVGHSLKQSLHAASVVMEEERSSAGSSNASTRSSLSNKELSDIASRAMTMAGRKTGSLRGSRTVSKMSHQEARRAILTAAIKRKEKDEDRNIGDEIEDQETTERLGAMAKRAVAMKKGSILKEGDSVGRNLEIASSTSNESIRSRRMEHPAFAARVPPSVKPRTTAAKLSSVDILTSFRQFNALRSNPVKPTETKHVDNSMTTHVNIEFGKKVGRQPPLHEKKQQVSSTGLSRVLVAKSPKKLLQFPYEDSMHDAQSIVSGEGSMNSRTASLLDLEETMHSTSNRIHDETIHSIEENHLDNFYNMGRKQVAVKNSLNEVYLSSLSSNTFSNQSIMSQSIVSSLKSPVATTYNEKVAFLLDPTPEYSNQTMKSEFSSALSPGPSNRSGHSIANSIISASPMSVAPNPAFESSFDAYFMEETKTKQPAFDSSFDNYFMEETKAKQSGCGGDMSKSSSDDSAKGSTELLDAAVEAAVADMAVVDTPKNRASKVAASPKQSMGGTESRKETIEINVANVANVKTFYSKSVSILPNVSGRSHSPPGFVFNDSDESDPIDLPPDPVGQEGFSLEDSIFAPVTEEEDTTTANGSSRSDTSFYADVIQGSVKIDSSVEFDTNAPSGEMKQGSSSTKKTVSSSIRSGMSSIQNDSVELVAAEGNEGSTSIRTGLSGLQSPKKSNESENSFSMHSSQNIPKISVEGILKDTVNADHGKFANTLTRYPDTIQEEQDTKSAQLSSKSSSKDDTTAFSGLKNNPTSTTDGSSGTRTASCGSSSGPVSSDSGNETGNETGYTGYNTFTTFDAPLEIHDSEPLVKNLLPPIRTEEGEGDERYTSPTSKSSRAWTGNFGKRVGDAIKNVLAKASPKAGVLSTPSGRGPNKRQESRSLFSSDDDDDDIFGGLEEDEKSNTVPRTPAATPKTDAKTPKQANVKSGGKKDGSGSSGDTTPSAQPGMLAPSAQLAETKKSKRAPINPSNNDTRPSQAQKAPFSSVLKKDRRSPSSPSGLNTNPNSLYSNDRSGTVLDESEVLHPVNSDITSSLIGGPISGSIPPPKSTKADDSSKALDFEPKKENSDATSKEKPPRSPTSKSKSSRKSKSSKTSSKSDLKSSSAEKTKAKLKTDVKSQADAAVKEVEVEEEKPRVSMFMNLGCGGLVDLSSGFASLCTPAHKVDESGDIDADDTLIKAIHSVSSHSRLTDLEKKVWSEWDRLNGSVMDTTTDGSLEKPADKKEDHDKKREAARDKLLDIASTALSSHISHMSGRSVKSSVNEAGESGTMLTTEQAVSTSDSTESGVSKDTGSGVSGNTSGTETCESAGSSSQEVSTQEYSTDSSSCLESDFVSVVPSPSTHTKSATTPTAGPILLSFSQRSLMEKFSKQLSAVGVEVLKLNTRKQWQIRYFTVSKEQIALSAHEAVSKTGEIAHCPKALLWLKKFNPKMGGYGITNIDKDGHGGMLLVDLVDIQVSDTNEDTLDNPIPKKLDKFKNSVRVTLQYKMNGTLRSIVFRCKDNDEAQFLCTCMRVIRDLLRRERSLRQKSNKDQQKKKSSAVKKK